MPTIYVPTAASGNEGAEQDRLWAEYYRLLDERKKLYAEIDRIEVQIVKLKPRLERVEPNA